MGHPTEMFEVADQIADHLDLFARVVSDRYPFDEVQDALTAASTPGTKGKVVITFGV
jgi:threonine dehydrogenase-like Zn-dependent dehydrogenase